MTFPYPPRVFATQLPSLMTKRKHDLPWLCEFLGVTPPTARRVMQGKDLKLSQALRLARYFKTSVDKIWSEA